MANNMGVGLNNNNFVYASNNNCNGAQTQQNNTTPQFSWEDNRDRQAVERLSNQISNYAMTGYLEWLENENRELGGVTTTIENNNYNNVNSNNIKFVQMQNKTLLKQIYFLSQQVLDNNNYIRNDVYVKELRRENNDLRADKEKVKSDNMMKQHEKNIKKKELNKNSNIYLDPEDYDTLCENIYLDTDDYDILCEKRDRITKQIEDIKNDPTLNKLIDLPAHQFIKNESMTDLDFKEVALELILKKIDYLSKSTGEKDPNNTKLIQ